MKNVFTVFTTLFVVFSFFTISAASAADSRDSINQVLKAKNASLSQNFKWVPKERMSPADSIATYGEAVKAIKSLKPLDRNEVESVICLLKAKICAFKKLNGEVATDCGCGSGTTTVETKPSKTTKVVSKGKKTHGKKFHGKKSRGVNRKGIFKAGGTTGCPRW